MTAPSPWHGITSEQEQDALTGITQMLTGTQTLKDQPGVVYALQQSQAQPQDAQAIDQFMQGLDAEKQVRLAAAHGQKIVLDPSQTTKLDALGVDYSGVQYTQQDALKDAATNLEAQNPNVTVKRDAQGVPLLDPSGKSFQVQQAPKKGESGWMKLVHGLKHYAVDDTLAPVGNVLSKGSNFVLTGISDISQQNSAGIRGQSAEQVLHNSVQRTDDMRAQGYDPNSLWSTFAFQASGKAHTDLTPLADRWDSENPNGLFGMSGQQAISTASQFLDNPGKYQKAIETDPASYNPDGSLTPAASDKLKALSSPQFQDLAKRVAGKTSSAGNEIVNALGLDPVKHATTYTLAAAGANLAVSFMIDPVVAAGAVFKAAKTASIGIDTLADSEGAAKILDAQRSTGLLARGVQRRTQNFIDMAHEMGAAQDAGDTAKAAALSAHINAQYKEWAPLVPDVLGKNQIQRWTEVESNGVRSVEPVLGSGEPIRDLTDMANYIASKSALLRLTNSRAAVLSPYMPGAVSSLGVRALKGGVAELMTARSAARAEGAYSKVLSAAHADPALAERLIDAGMLSRITPQADDAVNAFDGSVIASKAADATDETGLASAQRGALQLTAQGKGDVAFNLRRHGDPLGGGAVGWSSPAAIIARARLGAQRFTTLLPRNMEIDISDADASDKIAKFAMTYLNRGDANALRAAWNVGDAGQRKAIVHGLMDQIGHAAGLGKTQSGRVLLDTMKTKAEVYSAAGDEVMRDGENLALHPGQVRTKWVLPAFRDLHHDAAKIGLWEATMGRPLTSSQADTLMGQWKLGALFKPSTVTRNQLEGWLRTSLEGKLGDSLKAKAVASAPNKELWAHGLNLEAKGVYDELMHLGKAKEAKQLAEGTMLSGDVLGRSAVGQKIADFAPFALAGRAYRRLYGTQMDAERLEALASLGPDDLSAAMEGYGQQILESDLGMRRAARQSTDIAKAGFGPAGLRRAMQRGFQKAGADNSKAQKIVQWTHADAAGTEGADRYANALAQRVNPAPSIARAVLDRIEKPQNFDINHVVKALDDPAVAKQMGLTSYGKVYWEDPSGEVLKATTPDEVLLGKQEWAQKIVNDYTHLLMGQNGNYSQEIADYIRANGKAPDSGFISAIKDEARPMSVTSPEVEAISPDGKTDKVSVFNRLQDVEGAAYQWMVERPLQRTTSSPVFLANYADARVALNPTVDQLVGQGISRVAAENLAKEISIKNAWIRTENLIDDPGLKSQFDVVARNIFPFSRATQAMIRRWGGALWQDPTRAQKMMLAYEGAVHSGIVYNNAYGEPTFNYPGSGVMNLALRELSKVPGFGNFARFPVSASMTGGVLMSVPGADNPFRMAAGPMITVPMREIYNVLQNDVPFGQQGFFKEHRVLFDEIDSAINGPVGQGETFSQFVPTAARRFYQALSTDDRNSALASSTIGAIANLAAAGMVPKPDATDVDRQQFRSNLQTQVRNQLFVRAVFGLLAPAPPSQPSEGTSASQADYAFHVRGAGQLSDEYKMILNDVGGDLARANAIFTALHPDQVVFKDGVATTYKPVATAVESGRSQATTSKVSLPATQEALQWMTVNSDFINKYGSVAAYFLPEAAGGEPFSDQAYKTQIELGLRQRKSPQEFMDNLYVRNAENVFYPSVAQFDARITAAKNAGDKATAQKWTQAKSDWETQFKNMNPLFQNKIDSFATNRADAVRQIADLRQMVQGNEVPDGQRSDLALMLKAYDNYVQFTQANKGGTNAATAARSGALSTLNQWVTQKYGGTPLADLWDGVFRAVNSNLANLNGGGS